jgi:predicted N-acetyltransferase YhbS
MAAMQVRTATAEDVAACVELIEARRLTYEQFQPRFWKKAANSADMSRLWFAHLFAKADTVALVAVEGAAIVGFIIGANFPPPPVVELAGKNALIDDFAVASESRWADVGPALLTACKARLKALGYVQIVVVGARQDAPKTAFLDAADLSLASTWWTAGI